MPHKKSIPISQRDMSHLKNLPENKTIVSHATDMGGRNEAEDEGEAVMNVRTALPLLHTMQKN